MLTSNVSQFLWQAFDKDHNRCKSLIQNKLTKEEEQNVKKDMEKNMDASQKKKFRNIDANDPVSQ